MVVKAILFDLDGTLISTKGFFKKKSIEVNKKIFKKYGFNLEEKDLKKAIKKVYKKERALWAKPNFSYSREILSELGISVGKTLAKRMDKEFVANLLKHIVPNKRLLQIIKILRKRGFKLGIVVNYDYLTTSSILKKLGIEDFFDVIVTLDISVSEKKEAIPFIIAANKLRLPVSHILYVGNDIRDDVETPRLIGMKSIHIKKFMKTWKKLIGPIEFILIDVGNTLVVAPSFRKILTQRLFKFWRRKISELNYNFLLEILAKANKIFDQRIGNRRRKDLFLYSTITSKLLGVRIDDEEKLKEFEIAKNSLVETSRLRFKNTKKVLLSLKRRDYKLCIFSENWSEFVLGILKKFKLLEFDYYFISDIIGSKFEDKTFKSILKILNAKPQEILVIDDRKEILSTAKKLGMKILSFESFSRNFKLNKIEDMLDILL